MCWSDFWAGRYYSARGQRTFAVVPQVIRTSGGEAHPSTIMAFRDGVLVCGQPGAMPSAVLENLITQVKSLDMTAGARQNRHPHGDG